jgi:hypothetical protein
MDEGKNVDERRLSQLRLRRPTDHGDQRRCYSTACILLGLYCTLDYPETSSKLNCHYN